MVEGCSLWQLIEPQSGPEAQLVQLLAPGKAWGDSHQEQRWVYLLDVSNERSSLLASLEMSAICG